MNNRRRYAELLRQFMSGRMTNWDYEDASDEVLDASDAATWGVHSQVWFTYDDLTRHWIGRRHGMTAEGRRDVARWVMFLRSERDYEYRSLGFVQGLLRVLSLGLFQPPDLNPGAERDYWPYYRRTDFETDRRRPTLLCGVPLPTDNLGVAPE